MCIIIVKPAGEVIPEEHLEQAWWRNSDGGGFAYPKNGKVIIQKGFFSFDAFLKTYSRAVKENPSAPFLVHFRLSTGGKIDGRNCHPFRIADDLALAHNGVFGSIQATDEKSDTKVLARRIHRLDRSLFSNEDFLWLLERFFVAEHSKGVLLFGSGKHVILNEETGSWKNGCWYSNNTYQPLAGFRKHGTDVYYDCWNSLYRDECEKNGRCEYCLELTTVRKSKSGYELCRDCMAMIGEEVITTTEEREVQS